MSRKNTTPRESKTVAGSRPPLVFHETSVPLRLAVAATFVACLLAEWRHRYIAWAAIGLFNFPFLTVYRFEIDRLNRTICIQKLWLGFKQRASMKYAFAELRKIYEEVNDGTLCILEFTDGRRYETAADGAQVRSALVSAGTIRSPAPR